MKLLFVIFYGLLLPISIPPENDIFYSLPILSCCLHRLTDEDNFTVQSPYCLYAYDYQHQSQTPTFVGYVWRENTQHTACIFVYATSIEKRLYLIFVRKKMNGSFIVMLVCFLHQSNDLSNKVC
jgi:hypothetical protein